jgi:hypothetical protein
MPVTFGQFFAVTYSAHVLWTQIVLGRFSPSAPGPGRARGSVFSFWVRSSTQAVSSREGLSDHFHFHCT